MAKVNFHHDELHFISTVILQNLMLILIPVVSINNNNSNKYRISNELSFIT